MPTIDHAIDILKMEPGEYAIVELFGHVTLVGRVTEVERFGSKLMAIEPLFNGSLLSACLHGGSAIYRFTPCSAAAAHANQPHHDWQLPAAIRATLPAAALEASPTIFDVLNEEAADADD